MPWWMENHAPTPRRALHGVCLAVGLEGAGQIGFDLVAHVAAILFAELDADAGGAVALRTLGGDPDDLAGNRQFFSFSSISVSSMNTSSPSA